MKQKYDLLDHIIRYENSDLGEEEIIQLFQHLVDNGMAWTLQGSYGRMAKQLIENGFVHAH
jgi:hypothetical protein